MFKPAWLFLVPCLFFACSSDVIYQAEKDIPTAGWSYRDTVDFKFTIADTTALYNLYLDFEHRDTFAFQNLYLKLYTRFPDGKRITKQRSFDFFDAQGASKGKCSGGTCTVRSILQDYAFFNQIGEYVLTLEQAMRRDSLPGLRSVGLAVEKSKNR